MNIKLVTLTPLAFALTFGLSACGEDDENNGSSPGNGSDSLATLSSGTLVADGPGGVPDATGSVSIAEDAEGTRFVVLAADFMQEMGPGDTQILLARTSENVQSQRDADASSVSESLGVVPNGASGSRSFEIPDSVEITDFSWLIVWCPTAGVNFGAADLGTGSAPEVLRTATLVADGAGGTPDATGTVSLIRDTNGQVLVVLESDFMQEMGPGDTQVVLAQSDENVQAQRDADPANTSASLGVIPNGFSGGRQFMLPSTISPDAFDFVIIWCPTAGVNFGAGSLDG